MALEVLPSEEQRNKWAYLRVIYSLSCLSNSFYVIRIIFEFHVSEYNWLLLPLWTMLLVLPAWFLIRLKHYRLAAALTMSLTIALTLALIFLTGGIHAAGLFWIAMFPVVLSVLLGTIGSVVAYTVVIFSVVAALYINNNGGSIDLVAKHGSTVLERVINLFAITIFASITAHFYFRREKSVKTILIQKNNDVENLLRVLLHDIANTLSRMTYDLVKHKEGDGEPLEIEKIEKAMEDINTLLFQVRHLKSVKDGKSVMPMKGISLAMVLHEVYEIIESQAQQKGIKISMDMAREKLWVQGDRTILSNVILLNLLTNAIKFSHPGTQIDVRAYLKEKHVVVEVQDYGIGIPPEILKDLFSLNIVTTRPGTFGESGTGYGMPLVKEYLQLMGGQIDVASSEAEVENAKRGTLVTLLIPAAVV